MSFLIKNYINNLIRSGNSFLIISRSGHVIRGKPPSVAKSLEQRLQDENKKDVELTARTNVGLPKLKPSRSKELKERLQHLKTQRAQKELEKQSRTLIDLNAIEEEYRKSSGQYDLRVIADHYGIFNDLFGTAYFVPRVSLDIKYQFDDSSCIPVYNGNVIKPGDVVKKPNVEFDGDIDPITGKEAKDVQFWTLIATNPDCHLTNNAEFLHWFVANIPNKKFNFGDIIVDYLPPFPPRGVGYQRFVFVLYKQNRKLDFSEYKLATKSLSNFEKRAFLTLEFYRKHQDNITPAGLGFFQTDWDKSITDFYHKVLNMKEPIYEYDFPDPYLSDQKLFPLKQPFNLYMDKHRNIKQVNQEYLERKLSNTHPFEGPKPPLRFPNAHPLRDVPSWLKTEIRKQRLRIGRINDY